MKQIILVIVAAFVHTLALSAENISVENKRIMLTVEVVNGTANGHPVAGDKVTVEIREHETLVDILRGEVGTDGTLMFADIQPGEHLVAVAHVQHEGMRFSSHAVSLTPTRKHVVINVDVFDVSLENSSLSVGTHHLIIQQKDSSLLFTEYLQLVNSSDLAVSSDQRDKRDNPIVLTVPLPKGYRNFNSSGYFVSEALVFTQESFYDTMAVPPGEHQIVFSYSVDITSDIMNVTKKFSLPTNNFVLFSQLSSEAIQGLGEPDGQVIQSDSTSAEYYKRNSLATGSEVVFEVAGLGTSVKSRASWVILAVIFGGITFLAFFRLWLVRTRPGNRTIKA